MFSLVILVLQSLDKTAILVDKNTSGNLLAVEGKTFGFDNQPGRLDIGCKQVIPSFKAHVSRGPFLKNPFNFWRKNQIFNSKYMCIKNESASPC